MLLNSYVRVRVLTRAYFWMSLVLLFVIIRYIYVDRIQDAGQDPDENAHPKPSSPRAWTKGRKSSNTLATKTRKNVTNLEEMAKMLHIAVRKSEFYRSLNTRIVVRSTRTELILEYPEFNMTEPFFLSAKDRNIFLACSENRRFLGQQRPTGVIAFIRNGFASPDLDCGAYSNLDRFDLGLNSEKGSHVVLERDVICPLLVPDGGFFQHFLDGVLPKIIQIYDLLDMVDTMKLLLHKPRSSSVVDMLRQLAISTHRVSYLTSRPLGRHTQVNTCKTPPIHPLLWQRARDLLHSTNTTSTASGNYVILVARTRTRNGGRRLVNKKQIVSFLRDRYSERFKLFSGDLTFSESEALFSRASVVIGCHGGGMYNVHFSQSAVNVIEVMPITENNTPPSGLSHTVIWRVATALSQKYWRIYSRALNTKNDVYLPLDQLTYVLDTIKAAKQV